MKTDSDNSKNGFDTKERFDLAYKAFAMVATEIKDRIIEQKDSYTPELILSDAFEIASLFSVMVLHPVVCHMDVDIESIAMLEAKNITELFKLLEGAPELDDSDKSSDGCMSFCFSDYEQN